MVKHLHHTALKMAYRVTRQCEEACLSKVTRACAPKSERGGDGRGCLPRERGGPLSLPLSLPLSEALQYLSSAPLSSSLGSRSLEASPTAARADFRHRPRSPASQSDSITVMLN